jgi:hypothetical protein
MVRGQHRQKSYQPPSNLNKQARHGGVFYNTSYQILSEKLLKRKKGLLVWLKW